MPYQPIKRQNVSTSSPKREHLFRQNEIVWSDAFKVVFLFTHRSSYNKPILKNVQPGHNSRSLLGHAVDSLRTNFLKCVIIEAYSKSPLGSTRLFVSK